VAFEFYSTLTQESAKNLRCFDAPLPPVKYVRSPPGRAVVAIRARGNFSTWRKFTTRVSDICCRQDPRTLDLGIYLFALDF